MAYRFRYKALDDATRSQLEQFMYKYLPSNVHEKAFDALESSGSIPDDLLNEAVKIGVIRQQDIPAVKSQFSGLTKKLKGRGETYKNYIDSIKDEAQASDEDLKTLSEAYQGLGGIKLGRTKSGGNVYDTYLDNPADEAWANSPRQYGDQNREIVTPDYSADIKRINDILAGREFDRKRQGEVQDFLTSLPGQLEASRNERMSGEIERASANFQDYIPRAQASLNSRGLLFSGGVNDALTSKATDLASGLDDLQFQMEQEDNQFYFNAAYQNAIKTELNARDDYRAAIDTERSRVLTDRENRFKSNQSEYDRQLQETLTTDDLQRNYDRNKSRLAAASNAKRKANQNKLFNNIGSSAGAIAGASIGGPAGAVVGSKVGSIPGEVG